MNSTDETGWPAPETRAAIASRLAGAAAELTTSALARIAEQHPWFADLDAEHRSTVTLVARAGIDGFLGWFAAEGVAPAAVGIFDVAPRSLTRRITLDQTVDLVRTTIDTVEDQIEGFPDDQQTPLRIGVLRYSREVAFAAARVYAKAAEERGAWDARLEALVVDAVIRGEADESVVSRASTLGWTSPPAIAVVIGPVPSEPGRAVEQIRQIAARHSIDLLAAPQGDRLVLVVGGELGTVSELVSRVSDFAAHFSEGPVVVGPVVTDLTDAARSARAALSGLRSARAWPEAPRPVAAEDLLPERALSGDGHARRQLADDIYRPVVIAGGDLAGTLSAFFDSGGSIEATARAQYVHPNTVRYRLRRVSELTGYFPLNPRDAYALRLALTLGRLLE